MILYDVDNSLIMLFYAMKGYYSTRPAGDMVLAVRGTEAVWISAMPHIAFDGKEVALSPDILKVRRA